MKKIIGFISCAAVAALGFSACTAEDLKNDNETVSKTVTVHFGTENTDPASTKATLTPDAGEKIFQAAWVNGDEIAVKYTYVADGFHDTVPGTWDESNSKFTAEIQDWAEGEEVLEMKYQASYPYSADGYVDFGSARTQTGNVYNSVYDLMVAEPVTVTAKPGLDEKGNAIVFPMVRQTAIVYFHFTSDNTEAITKATLKVEGAAIAAETVLLDPTGMDYETGLSEIVLTTTGQTADDFTLWFNVLPTTYTKMTLTVETATKTFTISNTKEGSYAAGKLYKVKKEKITWTGEGGIDTPSTVTDVITSDKLKATGTSYTDFSGVQISSNALYAGNSAVSTSGHIQLRSKYSNSGIVTTASGGKVKKITIVWSDGNTQDRTLDIYGKNTPYESAANLYASTNADQGTKLGSLNSTNKDTELTITGDYSYVGVRSYKDALQLVSISIEWESGSSEPAPDTYSVFCATVTGGTLSASPVKAEAGAEVTLTATPDEGYAFNNDWSVKDADETEITVTDGKFTMPAKDVTVSGSFSKVDYTITKETCEGGSFTVKKDGVEVTKAQVGDAITLEASAAEGYEFDSWTVTNESTSKTVYVSENTFTMPGANVTVSANFLKADVIPVYASVADLIADGAPTSDGAYVTVTLTNEEITKFYTTSAKARRGVYFTVGTREIELFGDIACPEKWVEGGWISGTFTKCKWMIFNGTWELCPTDWTELTYAAPCETPVITLNGTEASITCATEGATVRYTLDGTEPTETSDVYSDPVTLTDGQTIKAKAFLAGHKSSEVAEKTYSTLKQQYSVTYTVASTSSVTTTGIAPDGSSATFKNTYSAKEQMTDGKSQTYTLKNYSGKTIKKVVLSMKSNKSAGAGTFSLVAGEESLATISNATNFNAWFDNTSYGTSYRDVTVTLKNDSYVIGADEDVVLIIAATTNSLYCQSITITYE